jgi:SPP1 gp7 family putative phage head morphogenesis protein
MAQANKAPLPRSSPEDIRELARLRAQNARLNADVDARRRELRRAKQAPVAAKPPVVAQPFEMVDPRCKPQIGTKVLPPLTPPIFLGRQMGAAIVRELREMTIETRALVKALASVHDAKEQLSQAMDAPPDGATVSGSAQMRIDALKERYRRRFATLAEEWSRRMIGDVVAQSTAQLNIGLKDIAERMAIQSTMATPRMRAVVEAATQASVGLITRIPEKYLDGVQTAVMSAITNGSGLNKLVPYLTRRYQGDARHAHLVALDQIRKVSASVNSARIQELGVKSFVWVHVGGERYPRRLHQSYSGKEFRYDDLPIIDKRTGERGIPGAAINCRCIARPVVRFTEL